MRIAAVLSVALLLGAGCLGGSDDASDDRPSRMTTVEERKAEVLANASDNATYLENDDYFEFHIHDYWGGAEERILMDEIVSTGSDRSAFRALFISVFRGDPQTSLGYAEFSLPNGSFVPEGTGELFVEVDATAALRNGQVILGYRAANADQMVEMEAQPAVASWTIPLEPSMADMPHASSTRWAWSLRADGNGAILDGEVSVRITAKRVFDIDAWPEHPDFWQGGNLTRLDLHQQDGSFQYADPEVFRWTGQFTPETITLPVGTLVPPETSVILVFFHYELDGDVKNNLNAWTELFVKEGSSSNGFRPLWWDSVERSEGERVYAILADETNWDSPYASESDWAFQVISYMGLRSDVMCEDGCPMGFAYVGSGTYHVEIQAFREVPPWLEDLLGEGDPFDDA